MNDWVYYAIGKNERFVNMATGITWARILDRIRSFPAGSEEADVAFAGKESIGYIALSAKLDRIRDVCLAEVGAAPTEAVKLTEDRYYVDSLTSSVERPWYICDRSCCNKYGVAAIVRYFFRSEAEAEREAAIMNKEAGEGR